MSKKYESGNFICSLREERGMDQKTLAQLLGVSPSAISQCENGGGIKTEKLFQLSELFGVTLDELLEAKRSNQTLEEKWDKLYNINNYNLHALIEEENIDSIKGFYNRIKAINDNFYKLLEKWIFKKTTDDEYKELCYLWQYFETTLYINKFQTKYVVCFNEEQKHNYIKELLSEIMKDIDKPTVLWELHKIFVLNVELCVDEITELIVNDDRIECEELNIACGKAMFEALPKISQDLIYSQLVYNSNETLAAKALQRIMAEHGAELLYLPQLNRFSSVDEDAFKNLDGTLEFDEALTNAMSVYQTRFINNFEYQSWVNLDYSEFQKCIDKKMTTDMKSLAEVQSQDMTAYLKKYKSMRRHIKYLKEVES